ncbi:MAG: hypothetical protein ACE367_25365 [Acidimicrobiales bacterium]
MVQYLRAANVKDGLLDLRDVKSMNFDPVEQSRFALVPGDVLVTEGSGSLSAVGASSVWSGEIPGTVCFQNTLLRLRPRKSTDPRFLAWWCRYAFADGLFASIATGANIHHLSAERVRALPMTYLPLDRQRAIAGYLDTETARIDALITKKRRMIELLEERVDSRIRDWIGRSELVCDASDVSVNSAPIRRVLTKLDRWSRNGEMITAFRDGEVTTRAARGREGFTNSWTEDARVQAVEVGDVVVHGLDGFSGAIGDAQLPGVCSPVYHVCSAGRGDGAFYGRLLRLLALDGYLGNFATSTRERAVDFRNWDLFGRIPVPEVPLSEQLLIGNQIRAIRPLRRSIEQSETLAQERRQALITAAVRGEVAIPGVAA